MVKKLFLLMTMVVALAAMPTRANAGCVGGVALCVTNATHQPNPTPDSWVEDADCEIGFAICAVASMQG